VSACRLCGAPLEHVVADLGVSPVSNDFLRAEDLGRMEPFYPLCALVCAQCKLVQLEAFEPAERIFSDDYAYFSSYSTGWLEHARRYTDATVERFGLDATSKVVEIASNDGYLLQYFVARGIPVLGVEPTANTAAVAIEKGIPTEIRFFGRDAANDLRADHAADLLIANNVLAHVPDLNDFVEGLSLLLAPEGVLTIEFPHLLRLIDEAQFDTIYHEHYSYFSLLTATRALERHGLAIFDVEEIPTHGGSLRIYAGHAAEAPTRQNEWSRSEPPVVSYLGAPLLGDPGERVLELQERERAAGLDDLATYTAFAERVRREKREIVRFFIEQKEAGVSIAGYGAPAKGNTLLNYCGIGRDFIDYTVDLSPHKQGRFLPGTRIPIREPDEIRRTQPELVFILPWNLRDEVMEQLAFIRDWGGRFAVRSPEIRVFP
jgi:SAM-dependent methyltransferase